MRIMGIKLGHFVLTPLLLILFATLSFSVYTTGELLLWPDPVNHEIDWFYMINESNGVGGGIPPLVNGQTVNLRIEFFNGSACGAQYLPMMSGYHIVSCVDGMCYAGGSVEFESLLGCDNLYAQLSIDNQSPDFDDTYMDCQGIPGFIKAAHSNSKLMGDDNSTVYYSFSKTVHGGSGTTHYGGVCIDSTDLRSVVETCGAPDYQLYYVAESIACTSCYPDGQVACNVMGDVNSGNAYICVEGQWQRYMECENGGWSYCGLEGAYVCEGVESSLFVADKYRRMNRITLVNDMGRELLSDSTGNYWMYSGDAIIETAFRVLVNGTGDDWPISSADSLAVTVSMNTSEVGCTVTSGAVGYSESESYYVDLTSRNCTLLEGIEESNITITVSANMSSRPGHVLLNPVLEKAFTLRVVRNLPLLDNFQIVKENATHVRFTGHIISLRDLEDIAESSNPFAEFEYSIFDDVTRKILKVTGSTGKLNATDSYFLDSSVALVADVGDGYEINVTVGADNYGNTTYILDSGIVSPYRVLYFKCRNIPKNTSFNQEEHVTSPVLFECAYLLENTSAVNTLILSNESTVYRTNDLSTGLATNPDDRRLDFERGVMYGAWVFDNPWEIVSFFESQGYIMRHVQNGAEYMALNEIGMPGVVSPSRYVGRWALLENPMFYSVHTYVDLIVEEIPLSDFVFTSNFLSFNQSVYREGDNVALTGYWYDPQGLVKAWDVEFYSDDGFSYSLTEEYSPDSCVNNSCFMQDVNCTGEVGEEGRLCVGTWRFFGIQECLEYASEDNSSCIRYKWKFFNGGREGELTGKLTLYTTTHSGVLASQSTTAKVLLSTHNLLSFSGWEWWHWLILILFAFIMLVIFVKNATR
ncbi:hypothetical protein DRQ25_11545 [Candidatus Fermentibacteria bacterium]|nr:MAG: hypothetical protein DRQ25_11545 [Candidatus Fermentibacteria bacterium]